MLTRGRHENRINALLQRNPVVAIIGARQVGKTTLARRLMSQRSSATSYFDLEDPHHLARLEDPMLALKDLTGLVVIDEIQRKADLFPVLRVLADRPKRPAHFLILGSASPSLLKQSSETLAGRIRYYQLDGLATDEVDRSHIEQLWIRGGFPRSFLADSDQDSIEWRRDFIRTFLERDLPQLGSTVAAPTLHRFWTMLAHHHGHLWNASELAKAFGVSDSTVRRYLDVLTETLVVRQLHPWHENLRKRQVKAPKIFLADSGILHALLNLPEAEDIQGHPKQGTSWEGFAIDAILARLGARRDEAFFWATYAGAEIDLVVVRGRRRLGFEMKRTVAPRTTHSMHIALADLKLERIDVVHAGEETFPLSDNIRALGLARVWSDLEPL